MQTSFLPEIDDLIQEIKNPCPICKKRECHSNFWTCKKCTKILTVEEYTKFLLEHFKEDNPFLEELEEMDNHLRRI